MHTSVPKSHGKKVRYVPGTILLPLNLIFHAGRAIRCTLVQHTSDVYSVNNERVQVAPTWSNTPDQIFL